MNCMGSWCSLVAQPPDLIFELALQLVVVSVGLEVNLSECLHGVLVSAHHPGNTIMQS